MPVALAVGPQGLLSLLIPAEAHLHDAMASHDPHGRDKIPPGCSQGELVVAGVFVRVYNEQPAFPVADPAAFCKGLVTYLHAQASGQPPSSKGDATAAQPSAGAQCLPLVALTYTKGPMHMPFTFMKACAIWGLPIEVGP